MSLSINMGGLRAGLNRISKGAGLRRGLKAGALYLKGKLAYYPPVSRRPQAHLWGRKQRAGFFAALAEGRIEVPYARASSPQSERMRERWQIDGSGDGLAQTIGNNASYAGLTIGQRQTAYHKQTGWRTAQDVVRAERDEVVRIVGAEVARDLG